MKKVFIKTFGCQMNVYDSDRITELFESINFEKTSEVDKAGCYFLNTCHIREKATEKVYSEIGRVKKTFKKKYKPLVIVGGCVAQAESNEMLKREPYIDMVIGPQSYHNIPDLVLKFFRKQQKFDLTEFDVIRKFDYLQKIQKKNEKVSSFLTIQEGCDKFCHFCVVPYTRGPEYSRPFKQVVDEARKFVDLGAKEITLLGQNVNAYKYEEGKKTYKLSSIIEELNQIEELQRIRFTTSHPLDMTDDLIACYKNFKKLMPFLHLPVQSGSNKILKLMNRKHTIEHYYSVVEKLLKARKDIELSSDFIVGYPGELQTDFEKTIELIKKIKFTNSYSFIYSSRPGTPAAKKKNSNNEKNKENLLIIQNLLSDIQVEKNMNKKGSLCEVLVENKLPNQEKYFGRNRFMSPVVIDSGDYVPGNLINVQIHSVNQLSLFGKYIKNPTAIPAL